MPATAISHQRRPRVQPTGSGGPADPTKPPGKAQPWLTPWFFSLSITLLAQLMTTGCGLIAGGRGDKPIMASLPNIQTLNEDAIKTKRKSGLTMDELQSVNMSFVDGFLLEFGPAAEELKSKLDTVEKRAAIQQWKLSHGNILVILASGQNSAISMVDITVCVTLARMIFEDYWVPKVFGPVADPLLELHRNQEKEIWGIADQVLTPEQSTNLHSVIEDYHRDNLGQRYGTIISISDYVKARNKRTAEWNIRNANLLSLFHINPLSGLDPATREVQETRAFAQRSMYYFQRLPTLLRWQVEMMVLDLARSGSSKAIADALKSFQERSDRLLTIADQLPDRLAQAQLTVLKDLSKQSQQLEGLVKEFNTALTSGDGMARSVNQAIQSLDTFTAQFTAKPGDPPDPDSKPFDVLDYSTAAQSISQAARDLDAAITSLGNLMSSDAWKERQTEINLLIHEVESGSDQILAQAAYWGALLLLAFFAGLIITLLLYRYLSLKWFPQPGTARRAP